MSDQVVHHPTEGRFELIAEGQSCRADYRLDGRTMDVYHTGVPPSLEGRGLASIIVRAVFDHARREGLKVRPSCSYVAVWARRHPEVSDLLIA